MMENELKRIADALEAIAIALQPSNIGTPAAQPLCPTYATDCVPTGPEPTPAPQEEKPAPKRAKAAKTPVAETPAVDQPVKQWTQEEIIEAVQRAVKVNRDATLAICRKYGYEKSLKDISSTAYPDLSKDLEGVK
jgi:hypothetical protein